MRARSVRLRWLLLVAILALAFAPAGRAATLSGAELERMLEQIEAGRRAELDRVVSRLSYLGAGAMAAPEIAKRLTDPGPAVRESAAYVLAGLPEAAARVVPMLTRGLSDDAPAVRRECARALARTGRAGRAATVALAQAAGDPQATVRLASLQALAAVGDPADRSLRAPVLAALADGAPELQAAACEAAGALGLVAARPKLRELLAGPSELLRPEAARALLRLGDPAAGTFVEASLTQGAEGRAIAARLLEHAADRASREQLVALLQDPELRVRTAAARSLVRRKEEVGLVFLVVGAEDAPDPREALAYVQVLDELGVPSERRAELRATYATKKAPRPP